MRRIFRETSEEPICEKKRAEKGNGVLTGLTKISKITSSKIENGEKVPCDGQLWYRGYRVEDLIGNLGDEELGFEKIAYLLLMGEMPDPKQEEEFRSYVGNCRTLPTNFTRDVIMKAPTEAKVLDTALILHMEHGGGKGLRRQGTDLRHGPCDLFPVRSAGENLQALCGGTGAGGHQPASQDL